MDFVNDRQEWIVEKWFLIEKHRRKKAEAPKPDYEGNPEVEAFYRRAARKKITERAAWYAKIMGVTYGRISIRAAKNTLGQLQRGRKLKLSLETDPHAAGDLRLCSSPRTGPQKTDEPFAPFLGRSRKSAARL